MISPHEMPLQFNCVGAKQKRDKPLIIVVIVIIIIALLPFQQSIQLKFAIATQNDASICDGDEFMYVFS